MKARPIQSRKGVKGQLPLAGSRDSAPCGVWGNAPTVSRPTNSKEAANKGAGSAASLPLTLRVRRRAPKLLFPQDSVKNHCFPFCRPCNDKNQVTWEATAKGSRWRPQTFVCFHCPLVASADAKPSAQHRIACRNNNIAHYANSPLTQASCARGLLLFTDAQPRYTASWSPFRPAPDRPSSSR